MLQQEARVFNDKNNVKAFLNITSNIQSRTVAR